MIDIVVSLDMAKNLRDAGWKQQESELWHVWYEPFAMNGFWKVAQKSNVTIIKENDSQYRALAAPTAEEILRELPSIISYSWLTIRRVSDAITMEICYEDGQGICPKNNGKEIPYFTDDTLANAAAAMWIYLKENNLLPDE